MTQIKTKISPEWLIVENNDMLKNDFRTIFDERIVDEVVEFYKNDPMVYRILSVEKYLPAHIIVELELRKPVALIEQNKKYYLISGDFVRLPGEFENIPNCQKMLPIIKGIKSKPPEAGFVWFDENDELVNAVFCAQVLYKSKLIVDNLKFISVAAHPYAKNNARQIFLEFKNNVRISWGNAKNTIGEVDLTQKLKNLELVLRYDPHFYKIKGAKIQFEKVYITLK